MTDTTKRKRAIILQESEDFRVVVAVYPEDPYVGKSWVEIESAVRDPRTNEWLTPRYKSFFLSKAQLSILGDFLQDQ